MALPSIIRRFLAWFGSIPPAAVAALALVALALLSAGGVFMYRTYTFVEHDNEFCLSCHLMVDPYERFAQSEHRGLGCKACHQPSMVERTQMALSQVLERPDEIKTHAQVPNSACAACHIEGNPEQWRLISNSVGHRVHMESDDPALQGLMCVECHSTSIHNFTTTNRTCAQAGCHEDTEMRLGRMSDLTIHCVGCHDFSRPEAEVLAGDFPAKPLQPRRDECLSCHAMRTLLTDFPADEPHDAACGACHNPHDQETPRQAQRTCATTGCHAQPDTLTPMHRGLGVGVLQDCLACHPAHEFRADGNDCLGCHQDIFQEQPRTAPTASAGGLPARLGSLVSDVRALFVQQAPARRELPLDFSHRRHREVQCTECHNTDRTHGAVMVTGTRECQACHHTTAVANPCTACHTRPEIEGRRHRVQQTLQLSTGAARNRALSFGHREHRDITCQNCHTESLTRASTQSCDGCHTEHHRPTAQCITCHLKPPANAHDLNSHLTCSGSGCHTQLPFQGVPRDRNACLSCHQDQVDHERGRECLQCHILPGARGQRSADAGHGEDVFAVHLRGIR
jgi:hypothetical protein